MIETINGPLQGRLYQSFQSDYTQDKKLWAFNLRSYINQHSVIIASASYFEILSDPAQSFINHRAALHSVKTTAISLNMDILNLDEFDPRCPNCTSYILTEEVEGEYLCLSCGAEGPITQFYAGGYTAAYINFHSQSDCAKTPQQIATTKSKEYLDGK